VLQRLLLDSDLFGLSVLPSHCGCDDVTRLCPASLHNSRFRILPKQSGRKGKTRHMQQPGLSGRTASESTVQTLLNGRSKPPSFLVLLAQCLETCL